MQMDNFMAYSIALIVGCLIVLAILWVPDTFFGDK